MPITIKYFELFLVSHAIWALGEAISHSYKKWLQVMCICSSMYEIVSGAETERLDFFSKECTFSRFCLLLNSF